MAAASCTVLVDEYTRALDAAFDGECGAAPPSLPAEALAALPAAADADWGLVLLVGATGCGKSLAVEALRAHYRLPPPPPPLAFATTAAVVSHPGFSSPENATARLTLAGVARRRLPIALLEHFRHRLIAPCGGAVRRSAAPGAAATRCVRARAPRALLCRRRARLTQHRFRHCH
jgi:hypothetical protein